MAFLAEEHTDGASQDYEMKVNINKTKAMVIRRKPMKIDMRLEDESVEKLTASNTWGIISVAT